MRNTPYSIRNNEIYGDMDAWMQSHADDNERDIYRLKRNLRVAREQELTRRQRQLLQMQFEQKMTVTQIAEELGLNKSTVSRTLTRARQRLYKCLQYTL